MENKQDPIASQYEPYRMTMTTGTYLYCSCGLSKAQPFCDGSHKGTGIKPERIEITKEQTIAWCGCRQSGKGPFCDGTHRKL